jgi:hypothetical protein
MKRYLISLALFSFVSSAFGETQLLGHSAGVVCSLSEVHKDENGNYAPQNMDQRMQLFMRCEATMELFPGRKLQGKEQCCLHITPADGRAYGVCPDRATGFNWKNGVKGELKGCGKQAASDDGAKTPPSAPYYTYLYVHCIDPELGGATSHVQVVERSSISCQDARDRALARANATNLCKEPSPGMHYPSLEQTGKDFKATGACP